MSHGTVSPTCFLGKRWNVIKTFDISNHASLAFAHVHLFDSRFIVELVQTATAMPTTRG